MLCLKYFYRSLKWQAKKKIDGGFKLEQIILLKNMISYLFIFLGLNSTAGKTLQSDLLHKFHEN